MECKLDNTVLKFHLAPKTQGKSAELPYVILMVQTFCCATQRKHDKTLI